MNVSRPNQRGVLLTLKFRSQGVNHGDGALPWTMEGEGAFNMDEVYLVGWVFSLRSLR